jgi:predicted PurR-regulated permease PerM
MPPGYAILRNAAVFMAVALALALVRFFQDVLTPLVVATFLLLLIDAVSQDMRKRLPGTPEWVRAGVAGAVIMIAFAAIGGLIAFEGPAFGAQVRALGPRLNSILAQAMALVGAPPVTIGQIFSGVDPGMVVSRVFGAARSLVSYGVLVIIYFGFLVASRAAFSRKVDRLYDTEEQRGSARRVISAVRNAVEQFVRLQTIKATMMALAGWALMFAMGLHDALFVAFLVFLAAYVPILGPIAGSLFPGILALAQFDDMIHPAIMIGVLSTGVFVMDNVVMPKLQSDELNIDPLVVLISLGFWGAILGAPGILLSTPLTVTVMAIAAEFRGARWLAILISRDGELAHELRRA